MGFKANYPDIGFLIIRVGLGTLFIYHGFPLLMGGTELWTQLGQSTDVLGITFLPAFWGFVIAFAECFGGAFLIFGILFKTACLSLLFTVIITIMTYYRQEELLSQGVFVLQTGIVLLGLTLIGPGSIRFSSK